MLKPHEVKSLRDGLVKKLRAVEIEYQEITHKNLVDTVGLKRKIEDCLARLQQLKHDISMLDKPFIFVDSTR